MSRELADRLLVLRDEVLDTAARGDGDPPGATTFDAIVRAISTRGETVPGLDLSLRDAITRRLAWGDSEAEILAASGEVCDRLLRACQRSLADPSEEVAVARATAEIGCAVARVVALAAVARAGRERAAKIREELAERRLEDALGRQEAAFRRMRDEVSDARRRYGPGEGR
jgi:hypothetical protein